MKKRMILLTSLLVLTAFITGQTIAYFTASDDVTNTFTVGDLDIQEAESDWNDETDGKNLYPGSTKYKNPTVKNVTNKGNTDQPGYVRMILEAQDHNGNPITDAETLALIWETIRYDKTYNGTFKDKATTASLVEDHVPGYSLEALKGYDMTNETEFVEEPAYVSGNKRVFVYKANSGKLEVGKEATLFTTVVIPTDWNQEQIRKLGDYTLVITTQAIQAKGFSSQAAAFAALDKEIADGTMQSNG
ncbi:MAG: SipW-dependent-type signal peptide-containing protein [Blautia sp.]|nr:SipW-dependent-type signal peptide-containing protein [Blautia sp.]